jgi:hypothetical protein
MEYHMRFFGVMRPPAPGIALAHPAPPASVPPVEAFFDRTS